MCFIKVLMEIESLTVQRSNGALGPPKNAGFSISDQ